MQRSKRSWIQGNRDRKRFIAFQIFIAIFALVLFGRLIWVQLFDGLGLSYAADRGGQSRITIPAHRGNIYDRNGRPLTENLGDYVSLSVSRAQLLSADRLINDLSRVTGRNSEYFRSHLSSKNNYITLGESNRLAYLVMMAPRLKHLHRILKSSGSIYLHCDQSASSHLKLLMDTIFGPENFLNCISWCYGLGGSSNRYWPRKHDDILWYSKTAGEHFFEAVQIPATSQMMKGKSKKAPDYWHIPSINNMAHERLGYPTQKPERLLEMIILSSSRVGDLILDPCCGSGTTLAVASKLKRCAIGIDSSKVAIETCLNRFEEQKLRVKVKQ